MIGMRFIISGFFILCALNFSNAQVLDFTSPASACLQENVVLVNSSSNITGGYQWDFCEGELLKPLEATITNRINAIDQAAGIVTVQDAGNYYSFVIDRATNSLHRLEYGASLENSPVDNLVTLPVGTSLLSPQGFNLIRVSGSWHGFVVSTGNNKVYRLDFGSLLTNSPAAVELDFSGNLSIPIEIEIALEGSAYYLSVINFSGNNLVVSNLGNAIINQPQSFNVVGLAGASNPYGFSIRKFSDSKWRGIVGSFSNGSFHSISFDNGLSQAPVVNDITSSFAAVVNPVKLALETWGDESVLLVMSAGGFVQRVHFTRGSLLTSVASSDALNTTSYGSPLAFSTFYDNGKWRALTFSNSTRDLLSLYFNSTCSGVSQPYSSGEIPPVMSFSEPGVKDVSLLSDIGGVLERRTKTITVNNLVAPQINYASNGMCAGNAVTFSSSSDTPIAQYYWDFGDTNHSLLQNPTHQYSSAGSYSTSLTVLAGNGCSNFATKALKIYSPPLASFNLPLGLICTNNEFTFTNTTTDNFDGNLTYEWLVNNILESTARDLKYTFTSEDDKSIKLKAALPGCLSEQTQLILNVQSGPVVGFSYAGKCEDETILFANESSGSISDYEWDFGDGISSSQQNPFHVFSDPGNYAVSLQANGTNGCASTLSKMVGIYSVPQTNFSLDLPPFACSGSLSQFNDLTPPMPDSNLASWAWSFGDPSNGTASQKNPLYTYSLAGDYSVSLTTTSNFGCSNSIQKTITIYPSPKADFLFDIACVNQGTQFTDASAGDIKSWLWSIQSNTYSVKDPVHIFKSAATHTALLTVTGTNNCINQISKNVNVPVPIVADFTSLSTCATKPALFDEINKGGVDPAVSWKWDFGDGSQAIGSPAQHIFPSTGSASVTMTTQRESGCIYSITKSIPITEPPKAQFTVFLEVGAAPFSVDFVNTSSRASSYFWKFGDALNSTSTEFSPSFTYTELGSYTAELTVENALTCTDSYSQLISVVVPQINAAIADFKLEKILGSDSWNSIVTVENKSNVALINPEVFLDISGNALISERIIGVIKPNELLTHTFTAGIAPRAVDFACAEIRINSDDYFFDNRQCVNVAEQYTSQAPYPNPAHDELILEWISTSSEAMEVIIYNASGQIIISRQYDSTLKGLNQVKVDVAQLTTGIYFASYTVDNKTQNFRFSVIR
jgi:PKD repeat protein